MSSELFDAQCAYFKALKGRLNTIRAFYSARGASNIAEWAEDLSERLDGLHASGGITLRTLFCVNLFEIGDHFLGIGDAHSLMNWLSDADTENSESMFPMWLFEKMWEAINGKPSSV